VSERWDEELTLDSLARADRFALRKARDLVAERYPEGLLPKGGFSEAFVKGALCIALGRPDHAVLPLLEADDREPLVTFELARVAQALGHPDVAVLALEGFAARAGGHHRILRLHTGVFLAQMCLATGRTLQALELYEELPVALLGGRPALMFARLLLDHGREDDARRLLEEVAERQPDLEGLAPLLDEARS
jgi:tetratricopeptide (TPR) repeat protein